MFELDNGELPTKNTADSYKSFIKKHIQENVDGRPNLLDIRDFPNFKGFYNAYLDTLKDEGKCEVKHREAIEDNEFEIFSKVGKICHDLMVGNPKDENYDKLLAKYAEMTTEKSGNTHLN